jgi:hypothetical protein
MIITLLSGWAIAESIGTSVVLSVATVYISSYLWNRFHIRIYYGYRSHSLHSNVRHSIKEIESLCRDIHSTKMSQLVRNLCSDVNVFVEKLEEKSPNTRMSVMTVLGANLVLVRRDILPQYLDIQGNGRHFNGSKEELDKAYIAIKNFDDHIVNNISLLERGDMTNFHAAIALLDPTQRTSLN